MPKFLNGNIRKTCKSVLGLSKGGVQNEVAAGVVATWWIALRLMITCVFHAGFGVGYFMSESYYRNFTHTENRCRDFVSQTWSLLVARSLLTQFSPNASLPGVPSIMGSRRVPLQEFSTFFIHWTLTVSARDYSEITYVVSKFLRLKNLGMQ